MKHALLVLSSGVALVGCSSPHCERADGQSLVTALRPNAQFRAMLKMFVMRTQTFAMADAKDSVGTKRKLDAALDHAVEKHGGEWERNLVAAWETLDPADLEKACGALGSRSPSFERFAERIGPAVKSKNEPVLKEAATEVLGEIWS